MLIPIIKDIILGKEQLLSFEEYVEKANGADSVKHLFDIYLNAVISYGYDRAQFTLLTDHNDINKKAGFGILNNFPQDWVSYYVEQRMDTYDPIIKYGIQQNHCFTWKDGSNYFGLTHKQIECLNQAEGAGLNNGIAIPMHSLGNNMAGVSLATSEKRDHNHYQRDLMTAMSNHMYMRFIDLSSSQQKVIENIILTNREREVLIWVGQGKSNHKIAQIINISSNTVDFHLRNIFKKLDVNSRVLAVVKAMKLGLINL